MDPVYPDLAWLLRESCICWIHALASTKGSLALAERLMEAEGAWTSLRCHGPRQDIHSAAVFLGDGTGFLLRAPGSHWVLLTRTTNRRRFNNGGQQPHGHYEHDRIFWMTSERAASVRGEIGVRWRDVGGRGSAKRSAMKPPRPGWQRLKRNDLRCAACYYREVPSCRGRFPSTRRRILWRKTQREIPSIR